MLYRSLTHVMLALVVTGCGSGGADAQKPVARENRNQPDPDKQVGNQHDSNQVDASKDAHAPMESVKKAAPTPVTCSANDLAKVLDFGALPALEGTEFEHKSPASGSALVLGTVPDVLAFYQKHLLAQGWKLAPDPGRKNTDEYAELRLEKDGYLASLTFGKFDISKEKGPRILVSMQFHGNLDTRALPSPGRGKVVFGSQHVTAYLTENTVAEAMAWASKALAALGWQKFTSFDPPMEETDLHRTLKFRKQGYALTVFVGIHPVEKKTHFQYMVSALSHELPTPAEASKVQFDDVKWQLSCETPGDWKPAGEFYQKAMPALGYKPLPGEDPQPTYWNLRFGTNAGDLITVQVSSKDRKITQIHIHGIPASVLGAIKKREKTSSKK
jgi:hypothetical protein